MDEALAQADQAARVAAIDPRDSILLEAPAGSGKTAVLAQRFLRLLCTVEEPGAILAITFTLKAAAEMRGRVLRALSGELACDDPNAAQLQALAQAARQHGAARGWNLLEDPGALRIQTIDAFNYWLASQLPLAARVGGRLSIDEQPDDLYRRAARRTLEAAGDGVLTTSIGLLFERLDNHWGRLEGMLATMLQLRGHWLRYVLQHEPQALCARVAASLADVVAARVRALCSTLPRAARAACEALPGVADLSAADALPQWRELARLTLTDQGWRQVLSARTLGEEFASPARRQQLRDCIAILKAVPQFEPLLRELQHLPAPQLSARDSAGIAALARVLAHAAGELQAQFAASGRVDYTYVSGAAREALTETGHPTELALRTGLALRHVLVDEFQDTSLAQFQLLESLTAAWEQGDGRTLFVVGDPMQSIYRFRDAEVGLFLAARAHGIGAVRLKPLKLTRNFRSQPALIEWTNRTFAQVFAPADELRSGAVAYRDSVPARTAVPARGPAVELRLYPDSRAAEAQALAVRVRELREHSQGSIAVLVGAHAHAPMVVAALDALGIETRGVDLVPLGARPIVRDLVQLARALHDLADRSAWLAVLRAPWCGVRLSTLSILSGPDPAPLVFETLHDVQRLVRLPPEELARLARVRAVLSAALERRAAQSPADLLESTWTQLGGQDIYDAADLADARALFNALAARSNAGLWQGPADFAALLANLFSVPPPSGAQAVQVMTIHRAKGLEFDHVFVPATDRNTPLHEQRLLSFIDLPRPDGGSDLLMAPVEASEQAQAEGLAHLIHTFERARETHERARLLYVAVTRARQTLHLSGAPPRRRNGTLDIRRHSLIEPLWALAPSDFVVQEGTPPTLPRRSRTPLIRLRHGWQPPQLAAAPAVARLPLPFTAPETVEFSWVGETQRHIGTLVHLLLARAAQRTPLPDAQEIERERAALIEQLRLEGVPAAERDAAAALVVEAVTRTLGDARGRWILDGAHPYAASELALTGISEGRLRSVVIDRCFVDEAGTRWVIDYKTSRHEGAGVEAFLDAEVERYRAQLSGYVALARTLGPQTVRAGLYFPLLGAFREVDAAGERLEGAGERERPAPGGVR
jgi:ATP-dependent helicase/nuclease subunit A